MNLRNIREKQRKKQNQVSKDLNLNPVTYNGYETGKSEPNIETLIKLADYYNVSMDYLIGRQFGNEIGYLSKEELEFVKMYLKLNQQNKYKIAGYALGLYSQQEED